MISWTEYELEVKHFSSILIQSTEPIESSVVGKIRSQPTVWVLNQRLSSRCAYIWRTNLYQLVLTGTDALSSIGAWGKRRSQYAINIHGPLNICSSIRYSNHNGDSLILLRGKGVFFDTILSTNKSKISAADRVAVIRAANRYHF